MFYRKIIQEKWVSIPSVPRHNPERYQQNDLQGFLAIPGSTDVGPMASYPEGQLWSKTLERHW
jgi:hypothetical protein